MSEGIPIFSPWVTFLVLYVAVAARYVATSGVFAVGVSWAFRSGERQISGVGRTIAMQELCYSLLACIFFALAGTLAIFAYRAGWTQIYLEADRYGYWYLLVSFIALTLVHETYFYWTHRWMHRPNVFKRVHRVHHLSRRPTAWASFSFHPFEAALEAAIVPLLIFIIPVHLAVLMLFLLFMSLMGTINHLGYELYPRFFARHPFFRYWISATHHQIHHEKVVWNYGLYFNIWDRAMGTQHSSYEERFDEVFTPTHFEYDLIIAGGGLSGGLLAYNLKLKRPELRVLVIERGTSIGGNHTWSFHGSDLPAGAMEWVKPLIEKSWDEHDVRFPSFSRTLPSSYHSITSSRFHKVLYDALKGQVIFGASVAMIGEHFVTLEDGRRFAARATVDARGKQPLNCSVAFQKFLGMELELASAHGLSHPTLMDATVEQEDGFRFIYLLPFTANILLVEDTHYSKTADISVDKYRAEILAYVVSRGWKVRNVIREELGRLPIPLNQPRAQRGAIGARGSLFHDTTGYSLGQSVRVAEKIANVRPFNSTTLNQAIHDCTRAAQKNRVFQRALNRMLFQASAPTERYKVLQRFTNFRTKPFSAFIAVISPSGTAPEFSSVGRPFPFFGRYARY